LASVRVRAGGEVSTIPGITTTSPPRPQVHGRSILLGTEKLHVRGVTYGTFRPAGGSSMPSPDRVRADFEAMVAAGANTLRTYEPPPLWLLEMAEAHDLKVLVGLAWEQHIAFLDEPGRARAIAAKVGEQVRACEAHPAILCYAVGNEIPASIVRWHGKRKVEGFLERLHWEAKAEDPDGLFTYVNYPSTEYLELPFLDLTAFNVFLEDERTFEAYLARLQNLSGDRPLLITEVGIDSRRNGEEVQARTLEWQVRHAFGTGAAGVFVFSWTDEWHRGGHEVTDWDFGLVDRERQPKPALAAVSGAFGAIPFSPADRWPRVSVIVCTHNGERTLGQCLERASELAYPDFELIVVDDGSSDASGDIALAHGAKLVQTEHRGLSFARNAGVAQADGEIVAFLDDDAYPDSDWLRYVAASLGPNSNAGTGGPNIPPDDDGWIADCVAAAPGGPIHVLISDREAEHVPGCNMAFRKSALEEIGGFDERFRVAGDDVDVCWRLQESGRTLGFSAGAVVMHRRRDTVWRYLKQQYGYGKAEALLERKWPSRYNRAGSSRWSGKIYDSLASVSGQRRGLIRYGTWGSGLFQSIYEPAPSALSSFLAAPELFLLIAMLGVLSALAPLWSPLLVALPLFAVALAATAGHALESGCRAHRSVPGRPWHQTVLRRIVTAALFFGQPIARLAGRLRNGLSPWRRRLRPRATWPRPRTVEVWAEEWRSPQAWLQDLQDALAARGGFVRSGGPFDRWDLDLRAGLLGGVRIRTAVEEHGSGRQLLRARIVPRASPVGVVIALVLAALAVGALLDGQHTVGVTAGLATAVLLVLAAEGTATAVKLGLDELERLRPGAGERAEGDAPPNEDLASRAAAARASRWPAAPAPTADRQPALTEARAAPGPKRGPR
jgi:glycosyltransferase involved in cell wall biosynthesis